MATATLTQSVTLVMSLEEAKAIRRRLAGDNDVDTGSAYLVLDALIDA